MAHKQQHRYYGVKYIHTRCWSTSGRTYECLAVSQLLLGRGGLDESRDMAKCLKRGHFVPWQMLVTDCSIAPCFSCFIRLLELEERGICKSQLCSSVEWSKRAQSQIGQNPCLSCRLQNQEQIVQRKRQPSMVAIGSHVIYGGSFIRGTSIDGC